MRYHWPLNPLLVCMISFLVVLPITVVADDAEKGLDIAKKMKSQEKGFGNYIADMKMVLISVDGSEQERRLSVKTLEIENDGDKSLAIFDAPADVKGTAFLSYTHIGRDDDQWLYLPALKRVKRISPRNQTASFMGSEFSYEDLSSTEVEEYTYQYIGEESCEEQSCFVIDRYPVDQFSGYGRQRVWVEKQRYIPIKIDFYDRKDRKLKTLLSSEYKQHLNRFWRSHKMQMINYLSGKTSVLFWDNFQFRQAITDADFHPNILKRIR